VAAHLLSGYQKRYATFFVYCSLVPPLRSLLAIGASDACSFSNFLVGLVAIQNCGLHPRRRFQTYQRCPDVSFQNY
jgi:hypothetical protein